MRNKKRGLPTLHNGRRYRSLLEARWASFFDLVGWRYEYEPYALSGWIPDFLLLSEQPVLVEVKPVYVFPKFIAEEIENSGAEHDALILGCTIPVRPLASGPPEQVIGWLGEVSGSDDHRYFAWGDAVVGMWNGLGFCHSESSFADRISGAYDGHQHQVNPFDLMRLWATAGNTTQWRAPK